jgi:hypothetical protein
MEFKLNQSTNGRFKSSRLVLSDRNITDSIEHITLFTKVIEVSSGELEVT